jgi:glucosylceramidase
MAYLYVDGVAMHWYADSVADLPHALDMLHEDFPEKFILYSEACEGFGFAGNETTVILGMWERGENYMFNIIEDLNHWVAGWTDWNLALDMKVFINFLVIHGWNLNA